MADVGCARSKTRQSITLFWAAKYYAERNISIDTIKLVSTYTGTYYET